MGIGGAERLIGQAAVACSRAGHRVSIHTRRVDTAFQEMTDGNGLEFCLRGRAITPKLIGRLELLFQVLWTLWIVVRLKASREKVDLLISDLVPHAITFSKLLCPRIPHLLYCHYPDQLMSSRSITRWYQLYRTPLNSMEVRSFRKSDRILVNSIFTLNALRSLVPDLDEESAIVLYPGADPADSFVTSSSEAQGIIHVGRFATPKNHVLLLKAFDLARHKDPTGCLSGVRLYLVGGYDDEVADVRATYADLKREIDHRELNGHVELLINISDAELDAVWQKSALLVYPPENEHFGLVPIEAMMRSIPVIAMNSGGPRETVKPGVNGLLCEPTEESISESILSLMSDQALRQQMGEAGQRIAQESFSLEAFERGFIREVEQLGKGLS